MTFTVVDPHRPGHEMTYYPGNTSLRMADVAIINKIDLAERLGTNVRKMIEDAKKINPEIEVITTSAKTGENINKLIEKLEL